jgi:long-chain acyl-CoA synthetase
MRMSQPATTPIAVAVAHDILTDAVRRFAHRPAIDFFGRHWTYGELGVLVDRAAAGLQAIGVAKGDRVGLCLPNTPYSIIFYFAALKAGAIVVNYNPLYVARELDHQIRDSGTTVMVTIDIADIHNKLLSVAARSGLRKIVLCPLAGALPFTKAALYRLIKRNEIVRRLPPDGLHVDYATLMATAAAPAPVIIEPDDIAVLQYTGGTTGTPKGAILTHANVVANCDQVVSFNASMRPGQERMLAILPFFHVFAMTVVMNVGIAIGAEIILLPRFILSQCLKTLVRRKATMFPAVPTIYAAIAKEAEKTRCDLSSIRYCISGGAPLPIETRHRFEALTGCRVIEGYGLTEASPVVSGSPVEGRVREGSVGLPMKDTVIEIRDLVTGERLRSPGEKGEIVVKGPQVMRGYWNKPADSAAVFDNGFLCTGDIGYLDADGYLFIVDRIKDVILCGGFNVYPRMIEEALYQHPAVAEAVVIGLPDPYRGQVPKAFVVLRDGHDVTPDALKAFLTGYISKIEQPKLIEIRTSLPKTFVGKLSKKELVEEERLRADHRS